DFYAIGFHIYSSALVGAPRASGGPRSQQEEIVWSLTRQLQRTLRPRLDVTLKASDAELLTGTVRRRNTHERERRRWTGRPASILARERRRPRAARQRS